MTPDQLNKPFPVPLTFFQYYQVWILFPASIWYHYTWNIWKHWNKNEYWLEGWRVFILQIFNIKVVKVFLSGKFVICKNIEK